MYLIKIEEYTLSLINESEDIEENESSENTESDNKTDTESVSDTPVCTYVFNENGEIVCAEDLVAIPEGSKEKPFTVTINETEESAEYNATVLNTINAIQENTQEIVDSSDTTALMAIYEDIQVTLNDVYEYLGLFIGLYVIGWMFSQLNSWRRNNKS